MGNQCQNGAYGNYNNHNRFQNDRLASRYDDGDDTEDCYLRSSRSSIADLMHQGLRRALTSISVLGQKTPNVTEHYTLGRELGEGKFGTTYLCTEISTGCQYACKSILKTKFVNMQDIEDVRREIQIMHYLSGQKNIVTIKDAYEDEEAVHIVMELCEGGELYDRITKATCSEQKAAELMRIIVGIIENCHSLGVMHRDLKPENFLLQDKDDDLSIKVIDFGLSVFFKPGIIFLKHNTSCCLCISMVIAEHLSEQEIVRLREMLEAMDTENGGVITLDELKEGLRGCCSVFKQTEINGLMEAADIDNTTSINWEEFIAAADGQTNYPEFGTMMQSNNSELGWQTMESSMNVPLREAPQVY
nr:unnamed protein product [Digitaria exilis]